MGAHTRYGSGSVTGPGAALRVGVKIVGEILARVGI